MTPLALALLWLLVCAALGSIAMSLFLIQSRLGDLVRLLRHLTQADDRQP